MFKNIIENVHNRHPLVHCITNYVSINDCANIVLASGGAPIMAEDINEVSGITSICQGLDINIGMLNDNKLEAMLKAGITANELGIPVVLDPVGAGSSDYRIKAVKKLMADVQFSVIRGNVSEIKAIANEAVQKDNTAMGVEAGIADKITDDNISKMADFIRKLSQKTGAVIAATGGIDMVADDNSAYAIRNGHKLMSLVTGAGCQLSALTAAYVAADKEHILENVCAAVCVMGISGELAYRRMTEADGNASYRNYLIDAVYNMTDDVLESMSRIERI